MSEDWQVTYHSEALSWADAQASCEGMNGGLWTPLNLADAQAYNDLIGLVELSTVYKLLPCRFY